MLRISVAAPNVDEGTISRLFDNLDLIIANRGKILSDPKYSEIKVPGLYVAGLYLGVYEISIGDILNLWDTTQWHTDSRYYYSIIGSPLSGMNTSYWYDSETKTLQSGPYCVDGRQRFLSMAAPAVNYLKQRNKNTKQSELSVSDLLEYLQ